MDIELDFDSSVANAPAGFTAAVQYAADQLDALILDPITVSISVSWDASVFGEGGFNGEAFSYSSVVSALQSHADTPSAIEAAANLPATDPNRSGILYLSDAEAQALGLQSGSNGPGADGSVTFGTDNTTLNFSTTDFAIPGEYDFVGMAEHELTHALGRVGSPAGRPEYIMDLYRYASPGVLQTNGENSTYFSIDGGDTDLAAFSTSSDLSDWAPSVSDDSFDAYADPGVANTISAVDETLLSALGFDVLCFTPGTKILTPEGPVPVEQLRRGDPVITKFSGVQPIKWIGISHYAGRFLGRNHLMLPVRIKAHALAGGIPAADLTVSPGHGIYTGGVLIPAWRLVNGVSITQAAEVDSVSYYHIELATHDVIFAENCPAESFFDESLRNQFHNAAEYHRLYAQAPARPPAPCLARVEDGFLLQAEQTRIGRRAGVAPLQPVHGPLRGYVDIAGPERVAGWAQCALQPEVPVTLEILKDGHRLALVLANRYRADLRQAGLGSGTHGFEIPLGPGPNTGIEVRRACDHALLAFTEAARAA